MRILLAILLLIPVPLWAGGSTIDSNGATDRISAGNVYTVSNRDASWGAWVKTEEDASTDGVIGKKNNLLASATGYFIYQDATDNFNAIISDGITQKTCASAFDYDRTWKWLVATYTGSSDTIALYEDGVLACGTAAGAIGNLTNTVNFTMGNTANSGNAGNENLAYGFFFNAVLSPVFIAELRWKPLSVPGNASYSVWPMWENGSTYRDYTGAFNATPSGFVEDPDGPPVMFGGGLPL